MLVGAALTAEAASLVAGDSELGASDTLETSTGSLYCKTGWISALTSSPIEILLKLSGVP